jgi:CheY-like chemotaxis protein
MTDDGTLVTGGGRFRLLGDQPHVAEQDPLGFDRFADDLVRLILTSRHSSPFTLGVEGGWGTGKSSLMRQIAHRLDHVAEVRTVWFNAWSAADGTALEGLIKSVLDELDPNVLRRAMRNQNLMGGIGIAASLVAGWFGLGTLADQVWRRMSVDPKTRNRMGELMRTAMEEWRSKGGQASAERLLVVFVDDLDRCSPTNVFQIFEAIKLYLDAPGLVFVIGFDQGIVSEAILEQKRYSQAVTSDSYLEKIVQITFRVPVPSDNDVQHLLEVYTSASRTEELFPESARSLVIERNQRNPRRIKRFINRFVLEYDLDPEWKDLGPETLVRVLIIHMYFPGFGRLLDTPTAEDPVGEFLEFARVYGILRDPGARGDPGRWTTVEQAFASHELPLAPDDERSGGELLVELERTLPEGFSDLAQNAEFRKLIEGLGGAETRTRLRDKLHRGRAVPVLPDADGADEVESIADGSNLRGRRILWIDDEPAGNARLAERFKQHGAIVVTARDEDEAATTVPTADLLISDIGRGANRNAGFDWLARLREERTYDGPAIFCTSYVTQARRDQARALRAEITDQPSELTGLAARLLEEARPARPTRDRLIFLSYRRSDSSAAAGRLADQLVNRFGADRVFLDIDFEPGATFDDAFGAALDAADVVLAIIGPRWLGETGDDGRRRLDDPSDFVRREIATALSLRKRVVPVLVGDATMPGRDELPPELAELVDRQAVSLRDESWRRDSSELVDQLTSILGSPLKA